MTDYELILIIYAKLGNKIALGRLIDIYDKFIRWIVRRKTYNFIDQEDLYQIAILSYIKSVYKFDIKYNVKLSTYAYMFINGEINKYIKKEYFLISKCKHRFIDELLIEYDISFDKVILHNAISHLSNLEKYIIYMRYFYDLSQKELGNILSFSQSKICRLEQNILNKLRFSLK